MVGLRREGHTVIWEGGTGREYLGWWGWEEEVLEGGAEMGLGRGWGLGGVMGCCEVRI